MPENILDQQLEQLIVDLHKRDRLRVWSIIITIFGDAVLPRGGRVWLGTLLDICAKLNIEAGSVRAAMSRLAQDGWVEREKQGRKSFYRLAETGIKAFQDASLRIYAPVDRDWSGSWSILMISEAAGETRDARRTALRNEGYGVVAPTIFIRPEMHDSPNRTVLNEGDFMFEASLSSLSSAEQLGAQAWDLQSLAADYDKFLSLYKPIVDAIDDNQCPEPLTAIAIRTLLIHDYRRLVLRDPMLPDALTGQDWVGTDVRKMVANLYRNLLEQSEIWLDEGDLSSHVERNDGMISMANRFA